MGKYVKAHQSEQFFGSGIVICLLHGQSYRNNALKEKSVPQKVFSSVRKTVGKGIK